MKILPPTLKAPNSALNRRHKPESRNSPKNYQKYYQNFRPCLRWDFGFTCPFCLLHEMDFGLKIGSAGTGQMSIEHYEPQSRKPSHVNKYENCLYACTRCNIARGNAPTRDSHGRRLLNPTSDAWGYYFSNESFIIKTNFSDRNASYTKECYDPNSPDKVERRRLRHSFIEDRLMVIEKYPQLIDRILSKAESSEDQELVADLLLMSRKLRTIIIKALEELAWYPLIPPNAPRSCFCKDESPFQVPSHLAAQAIEIKENLQDSR